MWLGDIAKGISEGLVSPLFSWLNKREDTSLEKFRVNGQIDIGLVQAHKELGIARINLLKDRWLIALQIFYAIPLGVFLWKVILWDKVFKLGVTDHLDGEVLIWAGMIMAFLFGSTVLDRWTRKTS